MTKNETILAAHIAELHGYIGELEGTLMAIIWWDIPEELKTKIKKTLKKKKKLPFPTLSDEKEMLFSESKPEIEKNDCEYCAGDSECCAGISPDGSNGCTRDKGHTGKHVACGEEHKIKEWD